MDDPLDQFFGLDKDGRLNSVKEPDKETNTEVLGDTFATDGESESPYDADQIFDITVKIPEDAELSDVTRLALEAYKQQIEILKFIEPKYRNRGFEVAQQYLTIARDAIKQDAEIKIKQDKQRLERDKADLDGDEGSGDSETTTKDNLYDLVKKIKHEA